MNDEAYNVTAEELRQFIERIEQLDIEKKDISEQIKEVFTEAKSRGYDSRVMRKIVSLRKKSREARQEEEAVLEMYMAALGME